MAWIAEQLLTAIAQAARYDCITEARMVQITGLGAKQVEDATLRLRKHGLITRTGPGCHKLTAAGRAACLAGARVRSGPRGQETGHRTRDAGLRQRAWNALRMGKKMTIDDIIMRAAAGGERDPRANLGKYLRALARAGYVCQMPVREAALNASSNGCVRWWLVNNTGPIAPVWRVSRDTLWDQNIMQEVELQSGYIAAPRRRPAAMQTQQEQTP